MSGTQHLLQSNRTGPETALIMEAENQAGPGSQVPSGQCQNLGILSRESTDTPKIPQRTLHGILGPLVSGTQLLFQSNRLGLETALIREAENPD